MEKLELYKILTIENEDGNGDTDYTIANMVDYNESTYLYLIEVDKEENLVENHQMIVRLVVKDGEESIEKVTEEKELKEVSRLFFELFKKMAQEEAVSEN